MYGAVKLDLTLEKIHLILMPKLLIFHEGCMNNSG